MKPREVLERAADVGRVLRESAGFRRRTGFSASELEAYKRERIAEVLARAATTPLFRDRCAVKGHTRLDDVEPIDKQAMMRRFDDGLTTRDLTLEELERHLHAEVADDGPPFVKSRYVVLFTSGSSALRGAIVYDRDVIAKSPAMLMARFMHDRPRRRRARIATILTPDPRRGSGFFSRFIPRPLSDSHTFAAAADLGKTAKAIEAIDPDILSAYPSVAERLAEMQADGRMRLRVRAVWCGGEVLTPQARARIGEVFGCPVRNMYGVTEGGYVAADCKEGRLHLAEDLVHLEVVDADMKPVAAGEQGEYVLLTHLHNRVQPLVRYRVEDRVRLGEGACPCGSAHRWIESIEGRSGVSSMFHVPDRAGRPRAILGWKVHADTLADPDVTGAQLTLRGPGRLEVAFIPRRGSDVEGVKERCRAIAQRLVELGGADPAQLDVVVRATDELERLPSGKMFTYRVASPE